MKIGYFGSPEISSRLLQALLDDSDHEVVFVCSNPDSPRKRSGKPIPTEVSTIAMERGIPLLRPQKLKDPELHETLQSFAADLYFIFAYGRLIPQAIIDIPPFKMVNLHASHLPELRGASPIQSAVLRGMTHTGWSLQFIVPELDAGDLLASSEAVAILPEDTAGDLTAKLLEQAQPFTLDVLNHFATCAANRIAQDHSRATFCSKITTEMSVIDWSKSTAEIHNLIRGLNPAPIARTHLSGKLMKILKSRPADVQALFPEENQLNNRGPGSLLVYPEGKKKRLFAMTGNGLLEILELQPENKNPRTASEFLNGFRISGDERFQ